MGRKCSVRSCSSDSTKPEHIGVTYHKIPSHTDVRPKWLSLCHIPEEKITSKLLYVCSRHFLRADFCNFKGKKYMLRHGVLPSVFPWDKSKLDAIKAVVKKEEGGKKDQEKKRCTNVVSSEASLEVSPNNSLIEEDLIKCEVKDEPDEGIKESKRVMKTEETVMDQDEFLFDTKPEITSEDSLNNFMNEPTDSFDQHQRSQNATPVISPIHFDINSKIEVLDNNNIWHLCKINEVDYEENEVLVHFEKKSNKCDEWISMSSSRLRPFHMKLPEVFDVGDRCMATWCDNRKFPATVTKKLKNDTYEILFDDGFTKVLKSRKMSKLNTAKPPQSSPLFEPVKTTKQERRDKKRKLNVAALFSKRARLTSEEKRRKTTPAPVITEEAPSPESQTSQEDWSLPEADSNAVPVDGSLPMYEWYPTWKGGKPEGIESTLDGADGLRKSTIVPDPRLPSGWTKHLTKRTYGHSSGKWDTVIVAPDGKRFRSRREVSNYLELHPGIEATLDMFSFSIYRSKRRLLKPKQKVSKEVAIIGEAELPLTEENLVEDASVKPEEEDCSIKPEEAPEQPLVSLKIVFENDAYKCPIDGCDKTFRRENLALMHVKHYHSEFTKYLESTPNVADLAYARTVGESLDRSPGAVKSTTIKSERTSVTPKVPKVASQVETERVSPLLQPEKKTRDSEIIKLLNQKPADVGGELQTLPSGKSDDIAMRDDVHIKSLSSSRSSQGIKTLLPVRHTNRTTPESGEEKTSKRKKSAVETADALKGATTHQTSFSTTLAELPSPSPHQLPPQSSQHVSFGPLTSDVASQPLTSSKDVDISPIPSAFDLAPPPAGLDTAQAPTVTQFDGVIIEGGKIIKLERMKQEEIINCTCGFVEEDGLMIQCELCLCWQHAYCSNIQKESDVPEKYVCYICQHPLRERRAARFLHDQDWLKQGVLPVASYHSKDKQLEKRFQKLKKCHDLSGGLLELREYLNTLGVKLKIAEAKNHPKLYLWSKLWEKRKLPEKSDIKNEVEDNKPSKLLENEYSSEKNDLDFKSDNPNDSMLMMILKGGKEDMPMLNMPMTTGPIIPRPETAIDSDDCRLNMLNHIAHAESLVEERLDDFEKQLEALEEGMNLEMEKDYPRSRQTVEMLLRDLDSLKRFSELPIS
ncbi:PHD finger protein 20-like protein 1 [Euwallacea fornicatus]|uniref:PHD finger protein 20-like protein 1 n=1 Tax=Euwallacea fornicatus TaxID=995702 RepID=UPI00338F69E2